jgi:hypothetical protein
VNIFTVGVAPTLRMHVLLVRCGVEAELMWSSCVHASVADGASSYLQAFAHGWVAVGKGGARRTRLETSHRAAYAQARYARGSAPSLLACSCRACRRT